MFKKLNLQPIYDSSELSIINELIIPLLSNSVAYHRGVGFFTSGWLRLASKGLAKLIENGGTAKIVVSPLLCEGDWKALVLGEEAKHNKVLKEKLHLSLDEISKNLEANTLSTLAWMVADELVEFKFAIAKQEFAGGDYHDKVGLFQDNNGDEIAIHGSFNDTLKGTLNGEAFSVFKSWETGQNPYVVKHKQRLIKLWNNNNGQFIVYTIPEAIKKQFIQYRTQERPYILKNKSTAAVAKIADNAINLRYYQKKAIQEWLSNERKGIFEMATGTGKTFTALATAQKAFEIDNIQALVVLVPYIHLLEQWAEETEKFGYVPVLCSGQHKHWPKKARSKIEDYNLGSLKKICLISVHHTASTNRFLKTVGKLKNHSMVVADEVHRLGSGELKKALYEKYQYRLGLSATPERWYDEIGTQALFNYFEGICYRYGLSEAIENKYLTPYDYNPILVELTSDELDKYEQLTNKIISLAPQAKADIEVSETLKILLLKRTELIAKAAHKLPVLIKLLKGIISETYREQQEASHILIYCAPGKHREILKAVSDIGLRCHEFVHTVSLKDRRKVLTDFKSGHIQVLVAVKCLDEGVDVPATQSAFILASSTNPMEYVQRRGRILRPSEGKNKANIYDFIVTPSANNIIGDKFAGVLKREMPRFVEFSSLAKNKFQARKVVREMLDKNGLLDLLDKFPWDIYREAKKDMLNDYE